MNIRWIETDETVGARRGDVIICIVADGAGGEELLSATVCSVRAHTAGEVATFAARRGQIEAMFGATAPGDVVVLAAGCIVAEGWLAGLQAAAYEDARVATATPLGSERAPLAIPAGSGIEQAADAVRDASRRLRPRVESAGGDCAFVRRGALELVGASGFPAGFSRRCVERGLCHVVADDVLVDSALGRAEPDGSAAGPLARPVGIARRAVGRLSVSIDARILSGPMNGTKLHVLELLGAVASTGAAEVTAIVPDVLDDEAARLLRDVSAVRTIAEADVESLSPVDVVHRPFQISAPADLSFLARRADRLVITHQDLISYHNPAYFPGASEWQGYRALTRTALAVADHVVFFSAHARSDALTEELVEEHRASVIPIGVNHEVLGRAVKRPEAPPAADRIAGDVPVMLCLGTDYLHKNRLFAIQLLAELQERHEWTGSLVLAGPNVRHGSSAAEETQLVGRSRRLADAVLDLGPVSESEKTWLLGRAALVVYPTTHEGFGLVPFEAADHDVPCLWAPGTALSEVLPDAAAGITPWDAAASADAALRLMSDRRAAADNVAAVRNAAAPLRWSDTAGRLVELYRQVCDAAPSAAGALERAGMAMGGGFTEDAVRLVGPDGALPREVERPLLALAMHPALGAPVFRALEAGYRISHRLRRRSP